MPSIPTVYPMSANSKNQPTDPELWEKSKATAKKRYEIWPSAYAIGHALKLYKDEGGGWKKAKTAGDAMRVARGKAKKDVGHGGLDEWFSGHGGAKGKGEEATWGDWVAISPVRKTLESGKKVEPGDIVGPCGISKEPDWTDFTSGGKDPLKCMPRQKAYDMDKGERAGLAKAKQKAEKMDSNRGKSPTHTTTFKGASASPVAHRRIELEAAWGQHPPQRVFTTYFPAYRTFQVKVMLDGAHVGGLFAEEAPTNKCPGDLEALSDKVGQDLKAMVVQKTYLPEELRGDGLGVKIYELALREAAKRGYALAPNSCWHTGMTSKDAARIWTAWRSRHVHAGSIFWGGAASPSATRVATRHLARI